MGQASSSPANPEYAEPTRSHYELLEISSTATEEEIKKAYRRRALELHPDRNFGKEAAATALFAEVQAAYSVLSDPQERAWYDAHQAEFVTGGGTGDGEVHFERSVKVTTAEDIRAMCASRNSAFSDFSDGPNGFFTKVRELFERLAMEEEIASMNAGWKPTDFPSFGSSLDEFQDVVKSFYATWGGFSTAKTFAWKDKYRPSADYDRRTRRAMEKENQKARDEAAREFNDAVRALVLFVRRRDPRYVATETTDAERQRTLREAAAAQAARSRKVNAEKLAGQAVPDWAQSRNDEEADDFATDEDGEDEHEEDQEEPTVWECIVCSKSFKSEGQYNAHERSKKHKQAVVKLKRTMRDEDVELGLDPETQESTHQAVYERGDDISSLEDLEHNIKSKLDITSQNPELESSAPSHNNSTPSGNINGTTQRTQFSIKSPQTPQKPHISNDEDTESSEEGKDDTYAPRSAVETRILGTRSATESPYDSQDESVTSNNTTATGTGTNTPSRPAVSGGKTGKAKEKRARRAAKEAMQGTSAASAGADGGGWGELECVACRELFASKNKLFEHIKRTGHARPVGDAVSFADVNARAGKKKKRKGG